MANKADRIQYKTWSGIRIRGTNPVPVPTSDLHIDRAAYLATSLESPKMGAVQSYDRAAMSGGPFHFTAIQPNPMVQGSLFQLLRHLEVAAPCEALDDLWDALSVHEGWFVARDGKLRDMTSGDLIPAATIRNVFTPPGGKVPTAGPQREQAEMWARLFHTLLSDPATYHAQQEFAIEYLMRGQRKAEKDFYGTRDLLTMRASSEGMDMDLALSVYHAHSVNAPGPAVKCLNATKATFGANRFSHAAAAYLIWRLGRYKYGRWQDTTDGRNRYDHTRAAARKSGMWPAVLFTTIMPDNLSIKKPVT